MRRFPQLSSAAVEAYDLLALPVWLFSVETLQILASNRAAQSWLGYKAQVLHSMTIADVRPKAERGLIAQKVRQFDGSATDAGVWTIIAKSGEHYKASFSWHKVLFDGTEAILASIRDITQLARIEAQADALNVEIDTLRSRVTLSQEHLSSLFDALPGKMLIVTPREYEIAAVSEEYAQAVMLDRQALLGQRLFEIFPDNPAEPAADGTRNLRASLQRVEALRVTDVMKAQRYPVREPDGTFQERFWLPRNKPVFDSTGELIYIVHRVEDVTELLTGADNVGESATVGGRMHENFIAQLSEARSALLTLEERDTRLRAAELLLDLGSWEYDFTTGAHAWSHRVFEIYGVADRRQAPDFEGYVALVHPDDRPKMLATYSKFVETGAGEIEFQHRILRHDGTVAHIRGVGIRHQAEGREIVVGFVQDITRYVEAEQRLRDNTHLQKTAGYMAKLGSWRADLSPIRITWSPETASIHDEPDGFSPTLDAAMNYYIPEHRARINASFNACAEDGQPFDEVMQIITAKGRRVWVRAIGEAVRDDAGQIVAVQGAFQDISDLVAARNASEALAERLHQTLEHISDAFFLLDREWRFSFLNTQAEVLLQRTRDELLEKSVWEEFPDAVGSTFQKQYETAVAEDRAVRFLEYFPPLAAWFEVNAHPTPEGLAVYFRNVTARRARDEHLRLLESAIARQNDILLITEAEPVDGPDGPRIVYVNEAFEKRTGYSREEVIGKTPRILQGPNTQRDVLDRIRQALKSWQPVRAELINYTKSGEEFWLELDIVPLADETGWFTHWISIERDITERKEAEKALRENEKRFRLIAKATGNAVWEWDLTTGSQWWSEGLKDIFGHDPEAMESTPTLWSKHVHPDDKERLTAAFSRMRAGELDSLHEQYRFRRADGNWADVEDSAVVVRDVNGAVTRVLGCLTDNTERLQLEGRLRQAQKMEAAGQLTGGVAHDFNNLLTVILGSAEVLADELDDQPDLQKLADSTLRAASSGAELTSRLLAFSRKQALEPRVLDVGRLIQGMENLLRRTLPESIDIEIVLAGGLWKTEIDPGLLESALLNLALNARDAMPHGGRLTIEMANAALDDDYVQGEHEVAPGQYVLIAVSDTGQGIPSDMLSRVFEPFFTTKEAGKGSGLGLSMVYGFVKQSGGHIRVYSEQDEGTTFKLYFPRSHKLRESDDRNRAAQTLIGGKETILVVEDDRLVREHVLSQLKGLGYQVLEAESGHRALEIIAEESDIHLLFTDVIMPGMGGRALAEAARSIRPDLRVLFTSGYTENSIVHNGRLDPGVDLLSKPYRRERLALKVRQVLDRPTSKSE